MFRVKSGDTAREDNILPYKSASIFFFVFPIYSKRKMV